MAISCEHGHEKSCFVKGRVFLNYMREGLCSMQLAAAKQQRLLIISQPTHLYVDTPGLAAAQLKSEKGWTAIARISTQD
jgi:hypothetical protein